MKLKDDRPFADPEAAVSKLLEIANGLEADHAGRIARRDQPCIPERGWQRQRIRRGDASGGCRRLAGIASVRCLREIDAEGRG
jgi:hypothetical protein